MSRGILGLWASSAPVDPPRYWAMAGDNKQCCVSTPAEQKVR